MRVIPYSRNIKPTREYIFVPEYHDTNSYSSLKKNIIDTKKNVFPDKYVHKHDWLANGYKSTYKKDFITCNKTRNSNPSSSMPKETKNTYIGKIYPSREVKYVKNFDNWNCPITRLESNLESK